MKNVKIIRGFVVCLLAAIFFFTCPPAHAIIWCHDYAYYRLTGTDPRPLSYSGEYGIGVEDLRTYLKDNGYTRYPFSNAIADPDLAQRILKPGYVLFIRDDHSGFVNEQGLIDHFIQKQGAVGTKYDVNQLPPFDANSGIIGGLYRNESLRQFLSRPFRQTDMIVEVWRK